MGGPKQCLFTVTKGPNWVQENKKKTGSYGKGVQKSAINWFDKISQNNQKSTMPFLLMHPRKLKAFLAIQLS